MKVNIIDEGYDAEDAISNGYIYEIITAQFDLVNRSQNGNDCDFKNEIIEYRGNNCFIPTKVYCFIKCINFLTGKDYKQQDLHFTQNDKRRSIVMTMARIQPCLKKLGIDLGYYNGERVCPRTVTNRVIALFYHFCYTTIIFA